MEFRITKRILTKVDQHRREIRHQRTQRSQGVAPSKRGRICEDDRAEGAERPLDLINRESHLNFIKIHLLSHFSYHICQFGNIPMYSTEFGDVIHKEQIKDRWRRWNKNNGVRQICHS